MVWWTAWKLKSSNAGRRARAAEKLCNSKSPRAVKGLLTALWHENREVREAAVEVLSKIDPNWAGSAPARAAVESLVVTLKEGTWGARLAAAEALGHIGDPRALGPLATALKDTYVRKKALEALRQMDPNWQDSEAGMEAIALLEADLQDRDSGVRDAAVTALGLIEDKRRVQLLVRMLLDQSRDVRQAASKALSRIDQNWAKSEAARAAVPTLVAALHRRKRRALTLEEGLRESALEEGIRRKLRLGSEVAVHMGDDLIVRLAAAQALGQIGDAHAVEGLRKALVDENTAVRAAATGALGQVGDAQVVGTLVAALSDPASSVRLVAAGALGQIGDARAVEPLMAALQDEDGDVRKEAAKALAKIDPKRAKS